MELRSRCPFLSAKIMIFSDMGKVFSVNFCKLPLFSRLIPNIPY